METGYIERLVDECIEAVDLDFAYSPVLHEAGSTQPVEVEHTKDGAYALLWRNALTGDVSREIVEAEALRRMRARYLVTRGEVFRSLNVMPRDEARAAAQKFSIGWAPGPGTPMARLMGMRGEEALEDLAATVTAAMREASNG